MLQDRALQGMAKGWCQTSDSTDAASKGRSSIRCVPGPLGSASGCYGIKVSLKTKLVFRYS